VKVGFHPLARRELIAAALYLEGESGLGSAFLDEYERWEKVVCDHPESCPEIGMGIRKGILPRFKYLIGYRVRKSGRESEIRVLYIRHHAQNRIDWGDRG